jgi:hypothetical protein
VPKRTSPSEASPIAKRVRIGDVDILFDNAATGYPYDQFSAPFPTGFDADLARVRHEAACAVRAVTHVLYRGNWNQRGQDWSRKDLGPRGDRSHYHNDLWAHIVDQLEKRDQRSRQQSAVPECILDFARQWAAASVIKAGLCDANASGVLMWALLHAQVPLRVMYVQDVAHSFVIFATSRTDVVVDPWMPDSALCQVRDNLRDGPLTLRAAVDIHSPGLDLVSQYLDPAKAIKAKFKQRNKAAFIGSSLPDELMGDADSNLRARARAPLVSGRAPVVRGRPELGSRPGSSGGERGPRPLLRDAVYDDHGRLVRDPASQ